MYNSFLVILIFLKSIHNSTLPEYILELRCDDYCRDITVDGIQISPFEPPIINFSFKNYTVYASKGQKLEIKVENNSGPAGISARIFQGSNTIKMTYDMLFWYPVDDMNRREEQRDGVDIGRMDEPCEDGGIRYYHFVFPYTIIAENFTIHPYENNRRVLLPLAEYTHSDCNNFMRLKLYNVSTLGRFIYIEPGTNVVSEISTSDKNNFEHYYKFHHNQIYFEFHNYKIGSNEIEIIEYTVHDHQSIGIKSNTEYITIIACDMRGSIHCEKKDSNVYYERCKDGYYFKETEHNVCLNEDIKENYYLDKTGDVYLYQKCYDSCASCNEYASSFEGEINFLHKCTSCVSGYYPIDNIPGVCLNEFEVNNDFTNINSKWTTGDNNYKIYKQQNGIYSKFYDNECKGEYPYLLENTNLCIKSCFSNNLYTLNGVCVHECPTNYILYSFENKCVEQTLLIPNNTNNILYTKETLNHIIRNLKHNILFYKSIKFPFHGNSFSILTLPLSEQYNHTFNHSYIDFFPCETLIRTEFNIPPNEELLLSIIEINNPNEVINQVEYALFTSKGEPIDINICDNSVINISYPVKDTERIYMNYDMKFIKDGINIYNTSSPFYSDICSNYTFDNNDLVLQDRKTLSNVFNLCEHGCNYTNINHTTYKVICTCKVKTFINTQLSPYPYTSNNIIDNTIPSYLSIVKCYPQFFTWNNIKSNSNFYINITNMIIQIGLVCLFFGFEHKRIREQLFSINSQRKNNKNNKSNDDIEFSINSNDNDNKEDNKCKVNIIIEKIDPNMPLNTYYHEDTTGDENIQKQKIIKNTSSQKTKVIPYEGGFVARMLFIGNSKCFFFRMINCLNVKSFSKVTNHSMFISLFTFEISTLYFISLFFISNNIQSDKFHNNGMFPKDKMFGIVVLGYLCKESVMYVMKKGISFTKIFYVIEHLGNESKLQKHKNQVNMMNVRFVFVFFLQEICISFYLYYSTLFEVIYPKSKKDGWVVFGWGVVLDVGMNFLFTLVHTLCLYANKKCKKKKKTEKENKK